MTRLPTRHAFLLLGAVATFAVAFADEKLADIACRSVHLAYQGPAGTAFYNEVKVEQSAEGTYFAVCGFDGGYFGIQEQRPGKKVVIFSVWDPGDQNDPTKVDPSKRVKLVAKDDAVRVGRFGNEGTGGQSFLDLDWKLGETYRFLVTAKVDGDRTAYSASIAGPGATAWRHLATFSTIAKGEVLKGYYAFIEDFRRNKVSATIERRAEFGGGWIKTKDGRWVPLSQARFTADSNPSLAIDAGTSPADSGRFFLATGGKIVNSHVKLRGLIDLEPSPDRREQAERPAQIPELP